MKIIVERCVIEGGCVVVLDLLECLSFLEKSGVVYTHFLLLFTRTGYCLFIF